MSVEFKATASSGRIWKDRTPATIEIELSDCGAETVSIDADGYWAPQVFVEDTAAEHFIELVPAGKVLGEWTMSRREEALGDSEVQLHFRSSVTKDSSEDSVIDCPASTSGWQCDLPVGRMDMRVEVPGYAPVYYWGITVERETTIDLPKVDLVEGVSLAGWVESAGATKDSMAPAQLILKPMVFGWQGNPAEGQRIELKTKTTYANEKGFFQFTGLKDGEYLLRAKREGYSHSEWKHVEVNEPETVLGEKIYLDLPVTMEAYVQPAVDAQGYPWILVLQREDQFTNVYQTVAKSPASLGGSWEAEVREGGIHRIEIRSQQGSIVHTEDLVVERGMPPLTFELTLVPIEGTVSLGGDPVSALLIFGTRSRQPNVRVRSNEKGQFAGYLPRQGEWELEVGLGTSNVLVDNVYVELDKDDVAKLEVELKDTRIHGKVLRDGNPLADALVAARPQGGLDGDPSGKRASWVQTDTDGEFEFRALHPGDYWVYAKAREEESDWQLVSVQEDREGPELQLELKKKRRISGRLRIGGHLVSGARLLALGMGDDSGRPIGQALTRSDGGFEMELPPSVSKELGLLVIPPGHPVNLVRIDLQESPLEIRFAPDSGDLRLPLRGDVLDGVFRRKGVEITVKKLLLQLQRFSGRVHQGAGVLILRHLSVGNWTVCSGDHHLSSSACSTALIQPGSEVMVELLAK